ncbi:MAG: Gx transporter family protein [Lachnospiraceae bacterium]|nr:Gx transporter family protein [Lachnospiraceae bacterium]
MKYSTKKLTILAFFTTLALGLYWVESLLPTLVPIPGIKLGLANIITLIILKNFSLREAFPVLLMRILIATFLFGQFVSLFYSLAGGICCLLAMALLLRLLQGHFLFLTSIFGALFHNLGQLLVAFILTQSLAVLTYLPFFILSGVVTGLFTGLCAHFTQKYLGNFLRTQGIQ